MLIQSLQVAARTTANSDPPSKKMSQVFHLLSKAVQICQHHVTQAQAEKDQYQKHKTKTMRGKNDGGGRGD